VGDEGAWIRRAEFALARALPYTGRVTEPNTAEDLTPLVARLPREEQLRLAKIALRLAANSQVGGGYSARPPAADEFSSDEDSLSWEAEGWSEFSAEG
jgi:hypothetical protein